jgi:hypothetical protein
MEWNGMEEGSWRMNEKCFYGGGVISEPPEIVLGPEFEIKESKCCNQWMCPL